MDNQLTKTDIMKLFTLIQTEFTTKPLDAESLSVRCDMWYDALKSYDRQEVQQAVYEVIQTSEFEPRIKNVLDVIKRNKNPYKLTPIDLWNEVEGNLKYLYNADRKRLEEVFDGLNPAIKRYFGNMPYKYLELYNMPSDQYGYEKARFLKSVQPFIDQQETADKVGAGDFFNQLTAGTLKALSEGKKK